MKILYALVMVALLAALCLTESVDRFAAELDESSGFLMRVKKKSIINNSLCLCAKGHAPVKNICVPCAQYEEITEEDCPVCKLWI